MQATVQSTSTMTSFINGGTRFASQQASCLVALGRERGWECRVVGWAPLPRQPVWLDELVLVPVEQDSSPIPARAVARVQAIYEAGLRPRGFVIAHEAPKLLSGPAIHEAPTSRSPHLSPQARSALKRAVTASGAVGAVVAASGAAALAVAAFAVAAAAALPLVLVAAALVVDPVLIAVLGDSSAPDGSSIWVEVDRWDS